MFVNNVRYIYKCAQLFLLLEMLFQSSCATSALPARPIIASIASTMIVAIIASFTR